MSRLSRGVVADPSMLITYPIWQHNDLSYQRQGFRLAHSEKPVLVRVYVQDAGITRRTSDRRFAQDILGP